MLHTLLRAYLFLANKNNTKITKKNLILKSRHHVRWVQAMAQTPQQIKLKSLKT